MSTILDDFLTVAEAARLVEVSPSTIWRWIDKGLLPAYRIGRRKIRVKRADLARTVTPARLPNPAANDSGEAWAARLGPLTGKEREQMLAAAEASKRLLEEQLRQRGGEYFPSSAELLREAREERLRQLP